MQIITQNLVGLSRIPKPISGSVTVWDSKSLTLFTAQNLYEFEDKIVQKDALVFQTLNLLQEKATLLAYELTKNRSNSEKINEINARLQVIQQKLKNKSILFIEKINSITEFDIFVLSPKENQASISYTKLLNYVNTVEFFRQNITILLTNLNEADATSAVMQETAFLYREKFNDLYNTMLDLENKINQTVYRMSLIKNQMEPALRDQLKLRTLTLDILINFKKLLTRLNLLEVWIRDNFDILCQCYSELSIAKPLEDNIKKTLDQSEQKMKDLIVRWANVEKNIGIVYERLVNCNFMAENIAKHLTLMVGYINQGLLKPGDNIQIEYTKEGYAIIHADFEPYPEREKPVLRCYDNKATIIEYAGPPCPPTIPSCPPISPPATPKPPAPAPVVPSPAPSPGSGSPSAPSPIPTPAPPSAPTEKPGSIFTTKEPTKNSFKNCGQDVQHCDLRIRCQMSNFKNIYCTTEDKMVPYCEVDPSEVANMLTRTQPSSGNPLGYFVNIVDYYGESYPKNLNDRPTISRMWTVYWNILPYFTTQQKSILDTMIEKDRLRKCSNDDITIQWDHYYYVPFGKESLIEAWMQNSYAYEGCSFGSVCFTDFQPFHEDYGCIIDNNEYIKIMDSMRAMPRFCPPIKIWHSTGGGI